MKGKESMNMKRILKLALPPVLAVLLVVKGGHLLTQDQFGLNINVLYRQ